MSQCHPECRNNAGCLCTRDGVPVRSCDFDYEDDNGVPIRKCGAPALYTTCDPVGGVTCRRHKCRCAKPLPAEERVVVLERENTHLRARLQAITRRRKGLRHQLECQIRGRENDYKQWYPYVRRAYQAERSIYDADIASRSKPKSESILARAWAWLTKGRT